jgi:hypothetical protein
MRTTFSEIHIFNDDLFQYETSFIFNRKEWGIGNRGVRTIEKGVRDREWVEKGCSMGHKP